MGYLLDTNICIFFLKGRFNLDTKISEVGLQNCSISEITVAELKYGAEKSQRPTDNNIVIENFITKFSIIPIYPSLDIYAREKARLKQSGTIIDDFDLLIGATAISNDMILVTNNISHLGRLNNVKIEDWTKN
ncbi:type II toxin-antitoxin system VapC family toxin [Paradesertivirga mongoliensis]|nr:type II toxin-antitoxin system VapC family toxin [Pedobacter mongoliensis]